MTNVGIHKDLYPIVCGTCRHVYSFHSFSDCPRPNCGKDPVADHPVFSFSPLATAPGTLNTAQVQAIDQASALTVAKRVLNDDNLKIAGPFKSYEEAQCHDFDKPKEKT